MCKANNIPAASAVLLLLQEFCHTAMCNIKKTSTSTPHWYVFTGYNVVPVRKMNTNKQHVGPCQSSDVSFMDTNPSLAFFFPQEEELRKSGDAKYAHLSNDLHVLIEVFAPPGEAYSRMSHALEEIKKFLVPVSLTLHLIFSS